MEYQALLPLDTFMVINKTIFTEKERKVLTKLYQPIIGVNAVALYLTLWDCLDKAEVISNNFTHHYLINNMLLSLSTIIEARTKLEAIGLIKSYMKEGKENSYIYELYSPASAFDFLNDPILSTLLASSIGIKDYNNIINYYKSPNIELDKYKEITQSFQDVYKIGNVIDSNKVDEIKNTKSLNLKLSNVLDVDSILSSIPKELLDFRKINKNIKELIIKLGLVYDLNESEMVAIITNSIIEKIIDTKYLQENCKKYYRFNNNNRLPSAIFNIQPEILRNQVKDASQKEKKIHVFETTSPYDFLKAKNKCKPTNAELDILKFLLIDMDLNPGVINVLLDYVLLINNNKLPRKYIETIASQWKKSNIKTVVDAMELASSEYNKRTKIKEEVKKEKPTWMEKDIVSMKATKEEQEELLKSLRED